LNNAIEKKNQFNKRNKKIIKRMRIKLKKKTYPKLELKDQIKKNIFLRNKKTIKIMRIKLKK